MGTYARHSDGWCHLCVPDDNVALHQEPVASRLQHKLLDDVRLRRAALLSAGVWLSSATCGCSACVDTKSNSGSQAVLHAALSDAQYGPGGFVALWSPSKPGHLKRTAQRSAPGLGRARTRVVREPYTPYAAAA